MQSDIAHRNLLLCTRIHWKCLYRVHQRYILNINLIFNMNLIFTSEILEMILKIIYLKLKIFQYQ